MYAQFANDDVGCKINICCLHNGHSLFTLLQYTTFADTTAKGIQTKYKYSIIQTDKQGDTNKQGDTVKLSWASKHTLVEVIA